MSYPEEPALLYDPIRYILEGGKRLRHSFVVRAAGLFRDDAAEDSAASGVLPAAEAVEMFHNFTLLHDDIMDNAPMRRGRESVFGKWGTNVAILSGDTLMILAYRKLCEVPPEVLPRVMEFFNEAAVKVCEGQRLDMDFEERGDVGSAEYLAMIELKTAALFVGAVSMGAVVGGASEGFGGPVFDGDLGRLREFALQFGVAFQMQDDLLDAYGDARLGKVLGGDILEGKKTFLKLYALSVAAPDEREVLELVHKDLRLSAEEKIARVLAIYERAGVRAATEKEIARRFALALEALDGLSVRRDRIEEFKSFAVSQLGRNK